ncbi:DNA (cytosine-5-)-methyltransferase [Flagellimonas zhangzhouensis]|uniref:Cytosine-specific methyltransferase n=1 Tax=Flagellimonas zhangzhouensis TaxID=1073328 RepID=A0A1H2UUB6_9FLAO|nr:DNA (cytosine-5-)-methyltransferase [Allomuricauda zhangzhouensis]SDQ13544.1 DNA (cytosine-5)-methyltransferase 1 [Allomuricauda zhangzhouensis]SDW59690.1 DNA (cytosine-5)-methyltransferase 1 [Allomuricauda zhangzhouensis]
MQKLRVCELFAGVGGFRLGLENTNHFEVVWSNQWEPSTKTQHASMVYEARFGAENHSNCNIEEVPTNEIPDHDILVGGFPCQDYSVATSLNNSKGLLGKKGVLWWSIHRILSEKKHKPKYLFLENVDRLLKSPSNQRGRDFAVMLRSLSDLGYAVEWRVINAAEYGMPQRRRRVFFLAYFKDSPIYEQLQNTIAKDWILRKSTFSEAFPLSQNVQKPVTFNLEENIVSVSDNFNKEQGLSSFLNAGICVDGKVTTLKASPKYDGKRTVLADILEQSNVSSDYFIAESEYPKWEYLKGAKKETRKSKSGFEYHYSEGSMVFPDALDQPSRTIITGEGGKTASRFKHVVQTSDGLRRLLPVELERLNMFPDNHTKLEGISDAKRAFFMGNALVVGIVEKVGASLIKKITELEK